MISFGTYELSPQNGVYAKGWRELHGAERALTVLKTVGTRGIKVLNSVFEGKVLELQGELIFDNSDDLITGVRNFVREMTKNGQPLTIENSAGTFVYDGVYVTNTNELTGLRDYDFQRYIEFRIVFLCPKGFARSTTQTIQTATGITSLPYSGSITIDGDTNPEPIISITLATASTITDVFFTNLTTNQQISITGRTFANGDVVSIDTEKKQVFHNTTPVSFNGIFPDFLPGLNNYQITGAGANSLVVDQQQYNSERIIYGTKRIAQSFQVSGAQSISQLGLLLKRVVGYAFALYDDFNDNSIDGDRWSISGQVEETGGKFRLYQRKGSTDYTSLANTDNKTLPTPLGEPVTGFIVPIVGYDGRGDGVEFEIAIDNGTHKIWFSFGGSTGKMVVRQSGGYYGATTDLTGQFNIPSTVEIIPVGSNIELYADNTLILTLVNKTIQSNSYLNLKAWRSSGSSSSDTYFEVDNVQLFSLANVNSDLTVELRTNNSGVPSSTIISNASLTISASDVGTDFSDIIKQFTTAPSLSGATTYHFTIYQSGGDINNYYVLKSQNTNVLANGNLETSENGGSSWTQVTGEDMYLKMWGAFPTGFDLTLILSYFASFFNIV